MRICQTMHQTATPTFEQDIATRVPAIQDLFAAVLENYCDDGDAGITTICERLGIHRKLAWQIRNVAYSPDPFRAVRFMPSKTSLATLHTALERLDASEELASGIRKAANGFDQLVEIHAGDRDSLKLLVESAANGAEEGTAIKWRQRAFQGNSYIWGAQARTQLAVSILNFSADKKDWFDLLQIRGHLSLKRMRPNVHWLIGQSVIIDDTKHSDAPRREPLDPEAAALMDGVPVLPEFCSDPLPQLRRRPAEHDLINDELLPAPVGFTGQQTIVTGEIVRNLSPIYATSKDKRALFGVVVRTPGEVLIYDHFVHRDLFRDVERELCVFSELNSPIAQDEDDRLPISEKIECLGSGISVARTPEVPGYMKLLRSTFSKTGWNERDFVLYRIRMAFPPMPASVVIRHPFPQPPVNS